MQWASSEPISTQWCTGSASHIQSVHCGSHRAWRTWASSGLSTHRGPGMEEPLYRESTDLTPKSPMQKVYFPEKEKSEVAQSCPTLCGPMDCSLPGSSVHGIFQARVLEWGAIAFSREPRDWTGVSHIVGRHFTIWATRGFMKRRAKSLHIMKLSKYSVSTSPSFFHVSLPLGLPR